ncbi:site-specific integrase [Paraclostridium tenue]
MKGSVRKRATWEYYFDLAKDENGKRRRKSKAGFKSKSDAEKALAQALAEFENTGRVLNESKLSVSEYLKYWYDNHVLLNCRYRTQLEYRVIINAHINPYLGHYYLKNITPATVKEFLDTHYKRNIAKRTMENIFTVLKYALDMAVFPYEYMKYNPAKMIKLKYKFKKTEGNRITHEDALKALNYLQNNYYNYYIPFLIMYHTGIRKGEVLGLQWDNIDFKNKTICIRQQAIYRDGKMVLSPTKTEASIGDIIMGDTLYNELLLYREWILEKKLNHNFVCVNTNFDNMSTPNISWIISKMKDVLNIKINAHGFRHLHGQLLLENKANIKGIQSRLRHKNIETTLSTYLKSSKKIDNDIVNIWESML